MRKIAATFVMLALLIPAAAHATSILPPVIKESTARRNIHKAIRDQVGTGGLNVRVSFPNGYANRTVTPAWTASFTIKPNVRFITAPPSGATGSLDAIKNSRPGGAARVTIDQVLP